jgi:hypothetical protein
MAIALFRILANDVCQLASFYTRSPTTMERIAIPVFESRVSPVLDFCRRLLVIDIDGEKDH